MTSAFLGELISKLKQYYACQRSVIMAPWAGIEPATYPLGGDRSIHWATRAQIGTEGRTRTGTVSPPPNFESGASTNSTTPAIILSTQNEKAV